MSAKLIETIETKLQHNTHLDEASRHELLALLATLKSEMKSLDASKRDHAESIAGFAGAAAHEATRSERNPALLRFAVEGLSTSVKALEAEHRPLVETVNGICAMLANLGI